MISVKQIEYIEILFNDVGFDTRIKRNDFISNLLGYQVKYLDDLTSNEASEVIEQLKAIKQCTRLAPQDEDDGLDPSDRFNAFRND